MSASLSLCFSKGGGAMEIEELKNELNLIPNNGAINKARRAEILRQIAELKEKAGDEND